MNRRFESSQAKADLNERKHRVTFEEARRVFSDPLCWNWL